MCGLADKDDPRCRCSDDVRLQMCNERQDAPTRADVAHQHAPLQPGAGQGPAIADCTRAMRPPQLAPEYDREGAPIGAKIGEIAKTQARDR